MRFRSALRAALLLLAAMWAASGQDLLVLSSGTVVPGAKTSITVSKLSLGPIVAAAIQFEVQYPAADMTYWQGGVAPSVIGAAKEVDCLPPQPGRMRCLVSGMNNSVIPDGDLVTFTFDVAMTAVVGPKYIRLVDCLGASPEANPVTVFPVNALILVRPLFARAEWPGRAADPYH